jgi:hypothetical protein
MREEQSPRLNVIFDPVSKSALINHGDHVTWLAGPFSNYRDALRAADRCVEQR